MTDQPFPVPRPQPQAEAPAVERSVERLTDFTPVPRRYRHDGWTPERQKGFILALAETGCVDRAARRVNIAQTNCYELKRAPGAEGFRRAWDAALDFAVPRLKDIAFQHAIEGELIPVFAGGKLMGFRRKYNDKLLMFCLRHYGQDANGRRTTINYFSTRASAGATGAGEGNEAASEASATTVRTVITGPDAHREAGAEAAAETINGFEGVVLDAEAAAAIQAALEACAARARAAEAAFEQGGDAAIEAAADDPGEAFVRTGHGGPHYIGALEPPVAVDEFVPFVEGEAPWELAGAEMSPERAALEDRPATPAEARPGRRKKRKTERG